MAMDGDIYIKHVVQFNCGAVLGMYQKMLIQWFGKDIVEKAPDNVLDFFDAVMKKALESKEVLKKEAAIQRMTDQIIEGSDENKDNDSGGSVPQGEATPGPGLPQTS